MSLFHALLLVLIVATKAGPTKRYADGNVKNSTVAGASDDDDELPVAPASDGPSIVELWVSELPAASDEGPVAAAPVAAGANVDRPSTPTGLGTALAVPPPVRHAAPVAISGLQRPKGRVLFAQAP